MQPGDRLAHFEIRSPLGSGGMGEVFMASDTRLGRDVALKILPVDFAADQERVARFRREAQVLASLNHPNISAIYGLEEVDGRLVLVMELARGQDLSERLKGGPLDLDEALRVAARVAAGLAEAHDKGIVHRDLKPANVMADADGTVKILDFGLARAFGEGEGGPLADPSHSPTITAAMTQPGVILGTAAYMSPEQARGQTAGRQADVWAFGCLLFEMLTGKRLFAGATVSDSVAAILKTEPDWTLLPPATPAPVRRLLRRCLEKDTATRLRDVGDAGLELADAQVGREDGDGAAAAGAPIRGGRRRSVMAVVSLVGTVIVATVAVVRLTTPAAEPASAPSGITAMSQLTDLPGAQAEPTLAPDGKMVAYVSWDGGDQDIFVQRVGGETPLNLTADFEGADVTPAFSPDGEKIAFTSEREGGALMVMGATGETPVLVARQGAHPAWSPDGGQIVYTLEYVPDPYSRSLNCPLHIVTLATGEVRTMSMLDAVVPDWSPHGTRIAYWTHMGPITGQRDIYTVAVEGGDPVAVTQDAATDWNPKWSPDGRWLYFLSDRSGSPDVWRVGIDEDTGAVSTGPEAVTAGMARIVDLSVSRVGTVAVATEARSTEILLQGFDPIALEPLDRPRILLSSAQELQDVSLSPDGTLVAYRTSSPGEHIWIMARDGTGRRRLVGDDRRNRRPVVSPDNRWVTFFSNRSGRYQIWAVRTDGSGLRQVTDTPAPREFNESYWLPDGSLVGLALDDTSSYISRIELPAGGLDELTGPAPYRLMPELKDAYLAGWSPDSRHAAFSSFNQGMAVLVGDLATGARRPVQLDGRPVTFARSIEWVDDDRVVVWEQPRKRAVVWDIVRETGRVLPLEADMLDIGFTDGGRTALLGRTTVRGDVWLLTFAGPPAAR